MEATHQGAVELAMLFGEPSADARELAAALDPAPAACWVAEHGLQIVFPDRRDDPLFVEAISHSALDNVDAMWRIIAGRAPLDTHTPPGAFAFAETAAEVGVPVSQFERVYRVGTALVWSCWYRAAVAHHESHGIPLAGLVAAPSVIIPAYLDRILSPTLERYDTTRAEARRTREQLRRTLLRQALDGSPLTEEDVGEALGVGLGGEFVAFALRADRLNHIRVVEPAKRAAGAMTALPYNHGGGAWVVWLWCPEGCGERAHRRLVAALGETAAPVSVGTPHAGVTGLGRTGREALEAGRMQDVLGLDSGVLSFADVSLEALLLRVPAEARAFAEMELGSLADDTPRHRTLRATALAWLSSASFVSTAAALDVHEHTVRKRIAQAEELRGGALTARRTELLVALRLMRLLELAER